MSVTYYGYGQMPDNKYDSFPFVTLEEAKAKLKVYTSFNPNFSQEKRFNYTGTEINQNKHQKPFHQRSIIEGLEIPINEFYNRVQTIQPRPNYVVNVDVSDSTTKKLFKKKYGIK